MNQPPRFRIQPSRLPRSSVGAGFLLIFSALFLTACEVGPSYDEPKTADMPDAWHGPTTTQPATQPASTTQPSVATTQPVEVVNWWTTFNDPTLNSLVKRGIDQNLDIKQAESRLRQARAARGVIAADFFPQVEADGSYTRAKAPQSHITNLFRVGFDATWELDIFGGIRRDIESADALIEFAVEDRRDVLVTLASEVAVNYVNLRGFQRQITVAKENLEADKHSLNLTRQRLEAGMAGVSSLDVAQAESEVATTESQIPSLETQEQQAIYSLSVLLGSPPATLADELTPHGPIPKAPPRVPVGLPSDLVQRRSDIRRAAANLHSATALIGVAEADLFPKFSLTGSLGLESDQLKSLANWSSRFYSFGPTVSWAILDFGKISSNVKVQDALTEQALLTYRQTVLTAMQDVENALIAFTKEQQRRESLIRAVAANRKAVEVATLLYTNGKTDFLNVLIAQRSLLTSESSLVQSDNDVATNLIALYKALGGGWEVSPATDNK